jgi:hypothetical protein
MRRTDAGRKTAKALRFSFSQSFANLRQRFSRAMVRSTIERRVELRSLIATISKAFFQEGIHPERRRHKEDACIAILTVGRIDYRVEQQNPAFDDNMPFFAFDLLLAS